MIGNTHEYVINRTLFSYIAMHGMLIHSIFFPLILTFLHTDALNCQSIHGLGHSGDKSYYQAFELITQIPIYPLPHEPNTISYSYIAVYLTINSTSNLK